MSNPKTFDEALRKVANDVVEIVLKKQADYGHDNIKAFGEFGLIVRTNDKIARLRNLHGKEGVAEPRIDAWRDIAGYALIALMLNEGTFDLELEGSKHNPVGYVNL